MTLPHLTREQRLLALAMTRAPKYEPTRPLTFAQAIPAAIIIAGVVLAVAWILMGEIR